MRERFFCLKNVLGLKTFFSRIIFGEMNVVVLRWNPSFSSYPMLGYLSDIVNLCDYDEADLNWSVWDYEKIKEGDRFFWVKSGYGATGIVASGVITSAPFESEDWSGKGRRTFYVCFKPEIAINPDALPILSVQELQEKVPEFDFSSGHSGVVLPQDCANRLENVWREFIAQNISRFAKAMASEINDKIYVSPELRKELFPKE